MSFMRKAVLAVAENKKVRDIFATNERAKSLVSRFVAGDSVEDGIRVAKEFAAKNIKVTLDLLGENVNSEAAASEAVINYVDILRQMKANDLEPNISVKLTMLGLDLGDEMARANMVRILDAAREVGGFVRIDMEGSDYTQRTMDIFYPLFDAYPENVGIVIQTYLHRSADDIVDLINKGARVRLVKGAYHEGEDVAIQGAGPRDDNYRMLMHHLMDKGNYPAIATHDPALIEDAKAYARKNTIEPARYEFQMLYGVREQEQQHLREQGYNMRVYVPFGTEWYAYYTRRIAERPANAIFVARQLLDRRS